MENWKKEEPKNIIGWLEKGGQVAETLIILLYLSSFSFFGGGGGDFGLVEDRTS